MRLWRLTTLLKPRPFRSSGSFRSVISLFGGAGGLRARVVSTLGANHEFAVAFGFGLDADLAEFSGLFGTGRLVPNSVLVPNIVRDGSADVVHFVESFREERDPTGALGNDLQCFPGALRVVFITQDSDRIHRRTALLPAGGRSFGVCDRNP